MMMMMMMMNKRDDMTAAVQYYRISPAAQSQSPSCAESVLRGHKLLLVLALVYYDVI